MSEEAKGRIFGAVGVTEEYAAQDWQALDREELLKQAIVALDGARMEAEENGDENYARHVGVVLLPFLEFQLKKVRGEVDSREGWTQWEREHYDAQADHEEWSHARSIFGPMVAISREVGNPALNAAMEKVLVEVEGEYNRTLDVLEDLRKRREA